MSRKRIKQYLMLLTAVGVVAVAASGAGTFATFNAETTNASNTFATGTLFLQNTANSVTCTSQTSSDNLSGSGCSTLITPAFNAPGTTETADLTLTNTGSINGSDIKFFSPSCTDGTPSLGTIGGAGVSNSGAVTSIPFDSNGIAEALNPGTIIQLTNATSQTDNFTVSAAAAKGATSVTVTSKTPTNNYPAAATSTAAVYTNFTSPTLICGDVTLTIQETNASFSAASTPYSGACAFPQSGTAACNTGTALNSLPTVAGAPGLLTLTAGGGAGNGVSSTGLDAGGSRYFLLTFSAPSSLGNAAQNRSAKIDLTWDLEQ